MCCACFCHGGLLSDIDGSIGGEETVIVGLGRLGLGWWGSWAGGVGDGGAYRGVAVFV
ncbi:hypothetical protein [Bartonella sp. CL100XZDX]|uniref:hypothetical protein n=1 Tax=Bartonella sp. CL100XZDX TaxID=3243515 RepID=UPI0035CEF1EF